VGGVARRATVIREERRLDPRLLLLGAGDFSAEAGTLEMYRSRFLSQTMVEMGYDAVAVGERELGFGLGTLKADAEAGLPLICANLYEGNKRFLPPSVTKKIRGAKVCVFALLGEKPRDIEALELRDPAAEGRAVLDELRETCDYVILLAHMERGKLLDLLPSLTGVDLVIRGHMVEGDTARETCADTLNSAVDSVRQTVFFAGDRGRNIGFVAIAAHGRKKSAIIESKLIHLDKNVADDLEMAEKLKHYQEEERLKRRRLELSKNLTRDEATGRIVDRYLGIEMCRRCHAEIMPRFVSSRHFRAFETLRQRGATSTAECLACHTTGYGRPGGYDPETEQKGAPYLQGVQCEACHGPGTMHARDGSYVKSARESCRACHTSKWSPDFEFETYWKRANHCSK
jgi:hypothetical protein